MEWGIGRVAMNGSPGGSHDLRFRLWPLLKTEKISLVFDSFCCLLEFDIWFGVENGRYMGGGGKEPWIPRIELDPSLVVVHFFSPAAGFTNPFP